MNSVSSYSYSYSLIILFIISGCINPKKDIEVRKDILVTTGGKKEMILLTDRPPNLETHLRYFKLHYNANDVFFVR